MSTTRAKQAASYGSWPTPVTSELVVRAAARLTGQAISVNGGISAA